MSSFISWVDYSPKRSRVTPDYYTSGDRKVEAARSPLKLRTSFALRYGRAAGSEKADVRDDAVRTAFKSPFYPFVLVSTSVGQEGLDFHPWCHEIWHWNLPGNPVDLEQREGRVHRNKGHAVRRNVAVGAFDTLRQHWTAGRDPWQVLFDQAAQQCGAEDSELVPYWIAHGPHKVRSCVPLVRAWSLIA